MKKPTKAERIRAIKAALARPDLPQATYRALEIQLLDLTEPDRFFPSTPSKQP